MPRHGAEKIDFNSETILKDLKRGRYGYVDKYLTEFITDLYKKFGITFNQNQLYDAWDLFKNSAGIGTMHGTLLSQLDHFRFSGELGKIGSLPMTIDWIINQAKKYSYYNTMNIKNGYSFERMIKDVAAKYVMHKWYNENQKLFPRLEKTFNLEKIKRIYNLFISQLHDQEPGLSKNIILNRFLIDADIIINSSLFIENKS